MTLEKGKTYTLSGYVKTNNISNTGSKGAVLYATYQAASGAWPYHDSSYISGTNGWQRVEVTFTFPSDAPSTTAYIGAGIYGETGDAYIDAIQLEEGSAANRYNLLENSSLEGGSGLPTSWAKNSYCDDSDVSDTSEKMFGTQSFKITGVYNKSKNLSQTVKVSGKSGDVFVVSGWANGDSVPLDPNAGRYFALDIGIKRTNGTYQWGVVNFNRDSSDWQYTSDVVIADSDYTEITYYVIYYNNENAVYFDGLQLYKETFSTSYTYDSNGNVISTEDLAKQKSQFEYNSNNDVIKAVSPKGSQFKYEYDAKRNISKATSSENVVYSFTYDSSGNPKTAKVGDDNLFINSTADYSTSGNYISKVTDSLGNYVTYSYNETKGVLDNVTDANGTTTTYTYDIDDRLKTVSKSVDGQAITNSYTYENDRIKTITHNGFDYVFEYDSLGNNKKVFVGTQDLITNNYEARTSKLLESVYGNNQSISYDYDILDRVIAKYYDGTIKFKYEYDASGNLGYHKDEVNQVSYRYKYDLADRLSKITDSSGNIVDYGYDSNNNSNKLTEKIGESRYVTNYGYSKDNRPQDTIYNRFVINNGQIEYFPLNSDTQGSKGTKATSENGVFEKDKNDNLKPSLSAYEASTNLAATNSSFEDGTTGWTTGDWNGSTGAWRIVNDGTDGSSSLESYDSDGLVDGSATNSVAYQYVIFPSALGSSKVYTLSSYAKRTGSSQPTLGIYCLDENGAAIPGGYLNYEQQIPENQWAKISQSFTVPAGTKKFMAIIRSSVKDKDTVGFDAVQVEEKSFSTPYTSGTSTAAKILYNLGVDKTSGTMGVWFKTNANNTTRLVISNEGTSGQLLNLYIDSSNRLNLSARQNTDAYINMITTTETITPGQWYFAAFKWQYDAILGKLNTTLYLNNNTPYTGSITDLKDFSGGTTSVGCTIFGYTQLNGSMEQYMYSGSAMSDADIQAIYNNGRGANINNEYDPLGRLAVRTVNTGKANFASSYQYINAGGGNGTSTRLSSITNKDEIISYAYDNNGNITRIVLEDGKAIDYKYNELNELKREDNQVINKTIEYIYDAGGNIQSKVEYPYTTGTPGTPTKTYSYVYGDANWKDKLTSFDGKAITYDTIGNPLTYDGWDFTWEAGRQLKSMAGNGQSISYKYNDSGIRTEKTVNSVITKYHLVGDRVTYETNGTDTIYYTYDSAGQLVSMNLNGTEYYYIRNGQGDIIGLFDNTGAQVVSYSYDTWGKVISVTGTLASTVGEKNLYRYRGYRYDTETELYYLQSRYYNLEWGRFINADGMIGARGELLSYNMFVYALNNPVNMEDPSGFFPSLGQIFQAGKDILKNAWETVKFKVLATSVFIFSLSVTTMEDPVLGPMVAEHVLGKATTKAMKIRSSVKKGSKVGKKPGPTIDRNTGSEVGRFIGDSKGNIMIEPVGGKTIPGKNPIDTHTLYPNGSNYQRLNPQGHPNNPMPHGHGHLNGTGPGMKGQGPSIDVGGNVVDFWSPDAHWNINK